MLDLGVPASLLVLGEHVVLVLATCTRLPAALGRWRAAGTRTRVSTVVVGAGSSALATTLFTAAFTVGDPVTPQVLQKLQPLVALLLAAVLLGERLRPRYALYAVPALAGAWLLAFPDPLAVSADAGRAALLAGGAAVLWAAGTVLGRLAGAELPARDLTSLRFAFGLVTMVAVVTVRGQWQAVPLEAVPNVVALALVSGLLALSLYYRALRRTPASRATLAELAFPVTAAAVGVLLLDASLEGSQWLGFVVVLVAVTALALGERTGATPAVAAPDRVEDAVPARR